MLALLGLIYLYFVWYPKVIRYRDFGISVPTGYSIHGIDVSHYQGDIIWHEVSSMQSHGMKLDLAFIKSTEGTTLIDPNFKKNWRQIHRTQMQAGAYHFFRCNLDPLEQANHFLKHTKLKSGDLLPVLDVETVDGVSDHLVKKNTLMYLRYVENRIGSPPILYTNVDFFKRYFSGSEFTKYPLWIAHYTSRDAPRIKADWVLWQYSESGRVNSIRTHVDFNVLQGGRQQLKEITIP